MACVAALCLYAANEGAPDEARARLVRKFLEKDQEKLKKVLERYGGYMRDVVAIEREGGADPLQTLARALGAGLHALRLCGAILAFCAVFAPAARPTLLEGLGRGGVGELANCISDLAAAVHEEAFRGGRRRGGGARGDAAGMGGGRRGGRTFVNPRSVSKLRRPARADAVRAARQEARFGRGRAPASRAATRRRPAVVAPSADRVAGCPLAHRTRVPVAASTTPVASANRRKPAA